VDSTSPRDTLVCVGDLVEDVIIWQHDVLAHGTDNAVRITRGRGGSAANVAAFAVAAAPVRFIGRVGDDSTGQALCAELGSAGVDVRVQRAGRTGTVVVLVDDAAQRTMFPDRAAAAELETVPDEWLDGAAVLHVTAYALAEPISEVAVHRMVQVARAGGARISLDASSYGLIRSMGSRWPTALARLAPDVFFANEDEAALVPVEAVTGNGGSYIAKHGDRPVDVHLPDGTTLRVPVDPVAGVVDSTGAGDAFAAGFLTAHLRGMSPDDCVRSGNMFAARVLQHPGARAEPALTGPAVQEQR
jgi:sugar/nucleoside kinase (ribokinase family)